MTTPPISITPPNEAKVFGYLGPGAVIPADGVINRTLAEEVARKTISYRLMLPSGVEAAFTRLRWEIAYQVRETLKNDPVFWSALRMACSGLHGIQTLVRPSVGMAYLQVDEEIRIDNRTAEQLASLCRQSPEFITAVVAEGLRLSPQEVRALPFNDVFYVFASVLALEFGGIELLAQDFSPRTPPTNSASTDPADQDSAGPASNSPSPEPESQKPESTI